MVVRFCKLRVQKLPVIFTKCVKAVIYLRNVGGIDIIGLGTDFDGFSGETDVPDTAHMQHLADVMSHDGFTDEEIEKVFSKNVLRVFRECWK